MIRSPVRVAQRAGTSVVTEEQRIENVNISHNSERCRISSTLTYALNMPVGSFVSGNQGRASVGKHLTASEAMRSKQTPLKRISVCERDATEV
jgi:hypothetical protein